MERFIMPRLLEWSESDARKPLLLNGARRVGKTWLLKELGRRAFRRVAFVNLDGNDAMRAEFDKGYDLPRLIRAMQAQTGVPVRPGETLLVLDEAQACPKALTALKYFCEEMPGLAVAAAGWLLGLTVHEENLTVMDVHPLSFREFLDAMDKTFLRELLDAGDPGSISSFSNDLNSCLRDYFFVGGMPEVIASFASRQEYSSVREVQKGILFGHTHDISKHLSGRDLENALAAWNSIPKHLGQENKRFVFGHVREGSRGKEFQSSITWLEQAGAVVRVPRVSKPALLLSSYADRNMFKLFLVDIGLLGAMARLDARTVGDGASVFSEFKGALTEQYVCQELTAADLEPCYWSPPKAKAELDFVARKDMQIYGIEVKSAENLRSKSLRVFHDKYPETKAVRFSLSDYRDQGWMKNAPLFAVGNQEYWR